MFIKTSFKGFFTISDLILLSLVFQYFNNYMTKLKCSVHYATFHETSSESSLLAFDIFQIGRSKIK